MIDRSEIKKILIIKFGGVGDVLLSTPVIANLKAYFPNAQINFLTGKNARDVVYSHPQLTKGMTFDSEEDSSYYLIKRIRGQVYDLVIDLFSNPRTALLTFLSGAKYRVGFNFRGRKYAYSTLVESRGSEVHNVQFNLDALRKLEIPIITDKPTLYPNLIHYEFADEFIKNNIPENKKICGVLLTGGWESKRYKTPDYIELIKLMKGKHPFEFVLLFGTKYEEEQAEIIKNAVRDRVHLFPNRPLLYLAALIKKCDIVIGSDSGPLHMAAAMNTPLLGIYGPTDPKLQGPYSDKAMTIVKEELDCLKCNLHDCPIGNICMIQLSKEKIIETFDILISKNKIILN